MTYRNETEHLRARVAELEGQVEALRGQRREASSELFPRRVKRQQWILVAVAFLATGATGLCALPTIGVAVEKPAMTAAELAGTSPDDLPRDVRLDPRWDGAAVMNASGDYRGLYYASHVDDPRVLVSCASYDCSYRIEAAMAGMGDRVSGTYEGRVYVVGPAGAGSLPRAEIERYASARGLEVSELRVFEPERPDGTTSLWVMLGLMLFVALGIWGAVFWHRAATKRPVPLPEDRDFTTRDAVLPVVLSIATCRLYELFWIHQSTSRLRRLTGRPDLVPMLDVFLTFSTLGLWTLWMYYRNAEAVDDALAAAGQHVDTKSSVLWMTIGTFACSLLHWGIVYKLQEGINLAAIEAMDVDLPSGDAIG